MVTLSSLAKAAHVLVVEDDASISRLLELELTQAGFQVSVVNDGLAATALLADCQPNLVVLDLMLPGLDGYQVFAEIKKKDPDIPVIMLTAKRATDDVIRGLELGADDYIKKPFEMAELIARIRGLLRKSAPTETSYKDLTVDLARRRVTRAGEQITLTAYEFSLLVFLMLNREQVLARDQIYRAVWRDDYLPGTNVVDVLIRRLRKKVDDHFEEPLIKTVRGVGYSLR